MQTAKVKYPIKYKLILLSVMVAVPFLVMVLYLLYALHNYSSAYDAIVGNMTVANNYNMNFKEEMDESLYKLVVGFVTFDTVGSDGSLVDPYEHLDELRGEFNNLMSITRDDESRARLQILLRNIDTLEDRVDDIRTNLETDVGYDINIEMLDNNIYVLTELIQDNIQSYIYYQTKSMEYLTNQLNVKVHSFTIFCGILLARTMYRKENTLPARVKAFWPWLHKAALHRFYWDELYLFITHKIIFNGICRPIAWFDRHIIDGSMDGLAYVTNKASYAIRGFQSGNVQMYVWWYLIGVLLLGAITTICVL